MVALDHRIDYTGPMENKQFSPEHKERVLSRDEIIVRFRDQYETPMMPPVELDETVRTTRPRFFQQMIAEQIIADRHRYHSGHPFAPSIERNASYEIGESYELAQPGTEENMATHKPLFKDKTGLWNEDYLKKLAAETISDELAQEDRHTYDHVAMFAIDLNGLKALNDYYGRTAGDAYLQRIADWLQHSETLFQLGEKGVTITRARLGGGAADEFMLLAKGDPSKGIDWQALWSETSVRLQEEMGKLDVSDIWPAEEIQRAIDKHALREKIPHLPRDLTFKATAGFGRTTLEYVLNAGEEHDERNRIIDGDHNAAMIQKLTGGMVSVSLKYMKEEKNMTKASPMTAQDSALGAIIKTTNR